MPPLVRWMKRRKDSEEKRQNQFAENSSVFQTATALPFALAGALIFFFLLF